MVGHDGRFGRAGEPDPHIIVTKPISAKVLDELCQLAAVDSAEHRARLQGDVEYWAARYDRWIRQEATTLSETNQRRTLEAALKLARGLRSKIHSALEAPESTTALLNAYVFHRDLEGESKTGPYHGLIEKDLKHLYRTERALATAISKWVVRRGPKQRTSLYLLIQELCVVFERYSGKKPTHNPYRKTKYVGSPGSRAGRFITIACATIDPDITETQLSTALSHVLRGRGRKSAVLE